MSKQVVKDDFYDKIKPRLHRRIGLELRLAGQLLDLGCGACNLVQYLAETYHQKVVGVDISDQTFPKARHTSDGQRYRCIRKNATHLSFVRDAGMDAVVSMWALHEMENPRDILRETHRVLRPGGEILVVDFPKNSLAQRLWNEDYYKPGEVKALLQEAGFENVQVHLIERKQVMWARGWKPANREI